jgi:hypothetical protein
MDETSGIGAEGGFNAPVGSYLPVDAVMTQTSGVCWVMKRDKSCDPYPSCEHILWQRNRVVEYGKRLWF